MSRSGDRLNNKSNRRELRYEEHNDYIPPLLPFNSIQCHPTIDHYARALNQSSYFYSTHRRSQIEVYRLSPRKDRSTLRRPYSSHIPFTYETTLTNIPITYSRTADHISTMSEKSPDNNNHTYEKLSECHSPMVMVENLSVKAPRLTESIYCQFPTLSVTQQEPLYTNTQSLYDNILYPESSSTSKVLKHNINNEQEKKSCASQTQLTWTMATFSSFVDLENQSTVIQQPDPATFHSVVERHYTEPSPSASSETVEHMKKVSSNVRKTFQNVIL